MSSKRPAHSHFILCNFSLQKVSDIRFTVNCARPKPRFKKSKISPRDDRSFGPSVTSAAQADATAQVLAGGVASHPYLILPVTILPKHPRADDTCFTVDDDVAPD
jgi:hypothetical protein